MAVNAVAARILTAVGLLTLCGLGDVVAAPAADADTVAYLVNVTVRPGYNFPNADVALAYGNGICAKIGAGKSYRDLVGETMSDFATGDEYAAVYLINQAANELCPQLIWQLRQSAAHYVGQPQQ
ncbi:DUF732 domain-containing protein [Mycobacterium sp. M26]|uniref:DUF732 domain-containing protein n=1 Tax=Mycobacterium sp. M26 TaxID=1762962 RepID=UPI00073F6025|nr:DUF732 domain-containing protein [Mycobacterium sp. M26]